MIGHGAQKLFGWWGGGGFEGTAAFLSGSLGLEPGLFWAAVVGGTEFFGGLALVLGLGTRLAALGIAIAMGVATTVVHGEAFFLKNNGFEFSLTLLLASVALLITGGGALSVDSRFFRPVHT
jgi:putative oxidoreductase